MKNYHHFCQELRPQLEILLKANTVQKKIAQLLGVSEKRNAQELANATIEALTPYKDMLHTITSDNGKEFAHHQLIAKALNINFYFARPNYSW